MTKTKSAGYSYKIVRALQDGDSRSLAVQLGRLCIQKDIPVHDVAANLGVSRQTVYAWFTGRFHPRSEYLMRIDELLRALKSQ